MAGTASSTESRGGPGCAAERLQQVSQTENVAWALQNEEHSFERKALEAEAKTGTRKKHGLSKGCAGQTTGLDL